MPGEAQAPAAPAGAPATSTPAAAQPVVPPTDARPPVRSFRDIDEDYSSQLDEAAKGPEKPKKTVEDEGFDDDEDFDEDDSSDDEEAGSSDDDSDSDADTDSEDKDEGEDSEEDPFFDDQGLATIKVGGKDRKFNRQQIESIVASGAHTLEYRQAAQREIEGTKKQLKQIHEKFQEVNEKITPAWEALQNKKLQDAFLELASAAGENRLEIKRRLREEMIPVVADYLGINMDWVRQRLQEPSLRAHHDWLNTKEENEFLKQERSRSTKAEPAKKEAESQGKAQMRAIQIQFGIPDSEVKRAVNACLEAGEITGQEPDFPVRAVVGKLQLISAVDKSVDAILATRPQLAENPKFVDSIIAEVRKNPAMKPFELARIIRKRAKKIASKEAETLTREVSRKALRGKDQSALAPNKAQPTRRIMKFSDILDEHGLE